MNRDGEGNKLNAHFFFFLLVLPFFKKIFYGGDASV